MHVLMLCALEVWALPGSGGAPSLARTLQAYSQRGHWITFVGATIGANAYLPGGRLRSAVARPPPDIGGVSFDLIDVPSLQRAVPLPGALRTLDQKIRFGELFPRMAARRAVAHMKHHDVDVVYAYEVHGALAARRLRNAWLGPTIARFQGTVLHPVLSDPLARLRKYEEVRAVCLPADLYIMTDDGTQGDEVLAALNPASNGKIRFWRNGLATDRLRPASREQRLEQRKELDIAEDALVLITASRLVRWKRVDRAIDAFAEIRRVVPTAILLIVGDGHERETLEEQARARGVADIVRFAGAVPQTEVQEYMHAADVFLAVADLSNVGNPLLEAMACGLAIVAVDAGDTRELIRDGDTGRLLPTGDPSLIAGTVVDLAGDETIRRTISGRARRYAEEHFWTWEERMDAEVSEVERIVHASKAARNARG